MNNDAELETISPRIEVHQLPAFTTEDLETVREGFQQTTPIQLRQAWLPREEDDFAPAAVQLGWRQDTLLLFAELTDADIFTRVTGLNQRAWELGDTFEIFLRPIQQAAYYEFHVTPNNRRLQVRFADAETAARIRRSDDFTTALIPEQAFRSWTWIRSEARQWSVYAEIPAVSIGVSSPSLEGARWRFSFSRYDYTRGREEPVISSTSPHAEPDFHRQQEWGWLVFLP